jgi:ElaB/YqjD/DUF883 family membrane-anchored ribosome-binding protein
MADPLHKEFQDIATGEMNPERQLPEGGNHRLNRTAEQIGGTLGKVVSQARRAPESARRGLHVVRDRAQDVRINAANQFSSSASVLAYTAQQRARAIAEETQRRVGELLDVAEERGRMLLDKADDITQNVVQRASELKQQIDERSRELQQAARFRAYQARLRAERLIQERPLHLLGAVAAAAFIVGVSLRIVRSRNASRY